MSQFANGEWAAGFPEIEDWIFAGRTPRSPQWVSVTDEPGPYMFELTADSSLLVSRGPLAPLDLVTDRVVSSDSLRGEVTADQRLLWIRAVTGRVNWSIRIWLRYIPLLICPPAVASLDPYRCPTVSVTLTART